MTLQAFAKIDADVRAAGGTIVAITPELAVNAAAPAERNGVDFPIAVDRGNDFARALGLAFALPDDLRPLYRVLLLDEPFSALDSFTRTKLQDHILDIYARFRFTVVLVTHDVEEAVTLSDRVLVMRGHPGRIECGVAIDLPRPRHRTAAKVQAIKEEIIAALKLA